MFHTINISPASLRQICTLCHPSRETDNTTGRFALAGVLFDVEDDELRAVGTDGRQMAIVETTVDTTEFTSVDNRIVNLTKLSAKRRSLKATDHHPSVKVAESADRKSLCFDWTSGKKAFHIECPIIEGRFPKWRPIRIHERDAVGSMRVERKAWVDWIDTSLPRQIGHTLSLDNEFQLKVSTPEPISGILPVKAGTEGEIPKMDLDLERLGQHLAGLTETTVKIHFFGKTKPILVKTSSTEFILMPLYRNR